MSSAVMNETDAGASVTGWSRSEAPNTCPESSFISSSRERSGSRGWADAAEDIRSTATTNAAQRLKRPIAFPPAWLQKGGGLMVFWPTQEASN